MKKYLVVEVEERVKTVALLKATIYGLTVEEYMEKMITGQELKQKEITCPSCNQQVKQTKTIVRDYDTYMGQGKLEIQNYPAHNCKCGFGENIHIQPLFNKLYDHYMRTQLRYGKKIPKRIDFNELLK